MTKFSNFDSTYSTSETEVRHLVIGAVGELLISHEHMIVK